MRTHGVHPAFWLARFPALAGWGVAAAGGIALAGWLFAVPSLRGDLPGVSPLQPDLALLLLCGGLALAALARPQPPRPRRGLGLACVGLAAGWGLLHLAVYVLDIGFGRPGLVFPAVATATGIPFAGGTSFWAAAVTVTLALAPLSLVVRRAKWAGELLVIAPLSLTFLGLVAEPFRAITSGGPPSALPIELPCLLLEVGLLLARPDRGWTALLTGPGLGGSLARWLLPVVVLVPFAVAWVRQAAEQAGVLHSEVGGVLYALTVVFVQSVLIVWYAAAANRTDADRREAEGFVRSLLRTGARLNSTLEVAALLDILADEAVRLTDAESGVAGLRAGEVRVSRGAEQPGGDGLGSLPDWSAGDRAPVLTADPADPRIDPKLRAAFAVRSALAVPVLDSRGEVVGGVQVHNKDGGFTPADRDRLVAIAQSAAGPLQNALAYRHLQEVEQALKAADRHKDEFLATLAHELRNPLAPLRNGLHILRLAGDRADTAGPTRAMMERQLDHMVRLIDDLLDLSRISRGKLTLRREWVSLADVIHQAVETGRPAVDKAGHELTVELPAEPVYVDADPTRLAQVVANLLTNAAKFTDHGGRVRLAVERYGDEAVVRVRDTGVGIPAPMLARVFDMFAQLDQSMERSQGGLGIGLSLVKGLVEMHGGTVAAYSDGPGRGSEFVVRLPATAPPAEAATAVEPSGPAAGRRILVVDDNRDAAISLAAVFAVLGHATQTAHDGLEALDVAAAFRPEVVFLDIGMPRLNGYDTASRIRREPWGQGVLLIALTGWGQEEDRRRSREAGFDHHVVKPIEPAALHAILGELPATPA